MSFEFGALCVFLGLWLLVIVIAIARERWWQILCFIGLLAVLYAYCWALEK